MLISVLYRQTWIETQPLSGNGTWEKPSIDAKSKEKPSIDAKSEVERRSIMKQNLQTRLYNIDIDWRGKDMLKKRWNFENIRNTDVLALKNQNIPLYEYLLIKNVSPYEPIKSTDLSVWAEFEVNFWSNNYMRDSTGAGDILPPTISRIEVTDSKWWKREGERRNIGGRPGYYYKEWKTWRYIDIYDADRIKIISTQALTEEQLKEHMQTDSLYYKRELALAYMRMEDSWKDLKNEFSHLSDAELSEVQSFAKTLETERAVRRKLFPSISWEQQFLSQYGVYLDEVCRKLDIPQEVMITLFEKESSFQSNEQNGWSSAYWLGQILDKTWYGKEGIKTAQAESIEKKLLPKYGFHGMQLDRENPQDQILASCVLLASYRDQQWGNLAKALKQYFWAWNISLAKKKNPQIEEMRIRNGLPDTEDWLNQAYLEVFLWLTPEKLAQKYNPTWKESLPKDTDTIVNFWVGTVEWLIPWLWPKFTYNEGQKSSWCGETARLHGDKFWVKFPTVLDSKTALWSYDNDDRILSSSPSEAIKQAIAKWGNVFDIVFKNTKWSNKWHRACAVLTPAGEVAVYDPYFTLGRADPKVPIAYDTYMKAMIQWEHKILVGLWIHQSNHRLLKQV